MVKDRYVTVPAALTEPIENVTRPPVVDILALGVSLQACRVRLDQANGRLAEIRQIGEPE